LNDSNESEDADIKKCCCN